MPLSKALGMTCGNVCFDSTMMEDSNEIDQRQSGYKALCGPCKLQFVRPHSAKLDFLILWLRLLHVRYHLRSGPEAGFLQQWLGQRISNEKFHDAAALSELKLLLRILLGWRRILWVFRFALNGVGKHLIDSVTAESGISKKTTLL